MPKRVSLRAGVTGVGDGRDTVRPRKEPLGLAARWPFPAAAAGVTTSWTPAQCPVWLSEARRRETGQAVPGGKSRASAQSCAPGPGSGWPVAADSEKPEL